MLVMYEQLAVSCRDSYNTGVQLHKDLTPIAKKLTIISVLF